MGMGKRKRLRKSGRARISVATTATTTTITTAADSSSISTSSSTSTSTSSMPSQSTHSTDLSLYANSTVPSDHGEIPIIALDNTVPESVPSLDRDLSTDLASDYLSTGDASLVLGNDDSDSLVEPDTNLDIAPADSVSVYAPSRYPIVPGPYRTEPLEGDNATV